MPQETVRVSGKKCRDLWTLQGLCFSNRLPPAPYLHQGLINPFIVLLVLFGQWHGLCTECAIRARPLWYGALVGKVTPSLRLPPAEIRVMLQWPLGHHAQNLPMHCIAVLCIAQQATEQVSITGVGFQFDATIHWMQSILPGLPPTEQLGLYFQKQMSLSSIGLTHK